MWYPSNQKKPFTDLIGKTLISVEAISDEIQFKVDNGQVLKLLHQQDCCESVTIESIVGDLADLVGTPILKAEEATSGDAPEGAALPEYADDSQTWTFYKLATIKGYVDIRWFGSSNGYYSESVSLIEVTPPTTEQTS